MQKASIDRGCVYVQTPVHEEKKNLNGRNLAKDCKFQCNKKKKKTSTAFATKRTHAYKTNTNTNILDAFKGQCIEYCVFCRHVSAMATTFSEI